MKYFRLFSVIALMVIISGCEIIRLPNGKYENSLSGRDDFAAVYQNLIILRLRNPENESGTEDGYWDWGGKYEVMDDNRIILDMDRETGRNWNFYYRLTKEGNNIKVTDHRAENSFRLRHVPAHPGQQQNYQQPAAYPVYK